MKFFLIVAVLMTQILASSSYEGTYSDGSFSKSYGGYECESSGSLDMSVSSSGTVSGSAQGIYSYSISGSVDSQGSFSSGVTSDGTVWSGTFTSSGVSGSYVNEGYDCYGLFQVTKDTFIVPTQEEVAKLYVATFNRAPDSAGLDYWVNSSGLTLSQIAQSFFDQPETQTLYPSTTSNRDFVKSVYANLFNREPDTAGWNYWENELNIGSFSKNRFIEAVINGALDNDTSNDATILENKTEVGLHFANQGLDNVDEAKKVMEGITDDTRKVEFIKNEISTGTISNNIWDNYNEDSYIVHNGIVYGIVTSPYTNKKWLDRNLGAGHQCTSLNDANCYGDYYQWGRNTDGHEKSTSSTTSSQATDISDVGHGYFITSTSTYSYDWAQNADSDGSLRVANWSKTDASGICPKGYRVPTIDELKEETIDVGVSTSNSFLKVVLAGHRQASSDNTTVEGIGTIGEFWSNSTNNSSQSWFIGFDSEGFYWNETNSSGDRANGKTVRCIEEGLALTIDSATCNQIPFDPLYGYYKVTISGTASGPVNSVVYSGYLALPSEECAAWTNDGLGSCARGETELSSTIWSFARGGWSGTSTWNVSLIDGVPGSDTVIYKTVDVTCP